MKRTLAGLAAAILLPAGIVAALGTPAAAAPAAPAAAPTANAASPAMLAALQRDLGLTETQARARIATDSNASRTELKLRKQLGTAFAGAWLTADATSFVVAVTDARRAAEVTAAGATPKVVARSAATLDAVKAGLDRAAAQGPGRVRARLVRRRAAPTPSSCSPAAAPRPRAPSSRPAASTAAAVRVVASTETPRTLYDVRGGDAYYIGGGRCSVGFSVNGGFVTAGHCGSAGTATRATTRSRRAPSRAPRSRATTTPGSRSNSNWTPQPWVNNYSGGNVTVAGSTEAAVGASICRSGSTTGWHCGTVQAKNQTVNYAAGHASPA